MKHAFILFSFIISFSAKAQNGRLLEMKQYFISDSSSGQPTSNKTKDKLSQKAVDYYQITYLSDSFKVKGFVAIPQKGENLPCIIFNRGGNGDYNMLTNESFANKLAFLVNSGYIVIASQYRGSEGSEGEDELGGGDVNDVVSLISTLHSIPKADTSRIGMYGWSRGAINTFLALTKVSKIKAAVVGAGFANLITLRDTRKLFDTALFSRRIPNYGKTKDENLLKARSAFYFAEKISKTTPILLLQGTADKNVPASQALSLAQKFYEVKLPFRLIVYEGGTHSLEQFKSEYQSEIINWFNNYLLDGRIFPNLEFRN